MKQNCLGLDYNPSLNFVLTGKPTEAAEGLSAVHCKPVVLFVIAFLLTLMIYYFPDCSVQDGAAQLQQGGGGKRGEGQA